MVIKKVILEHFKRHTSLEVELSRGVNAICGPNGAGKSSIIEAIGFALFNFSPYRSRNELIRKGEKRAKIIVEFESPVDHCLYMAERNISIAGNNRYTVRDALTASVMAEGTGDCQELLLKLMGAEEEGKLDRLFDTMLGVPQGTITAAFLASAGERKAIFGPLLRVEEYELASKHMKHAFLDPVIAAHHKREIELQVTQSKLEDLPQKLLEREQLETTIAQTERELANLTERKPALEETRKSLQQQQEALRTCHQQLHVAQQKETSLSQQLIRAARELEQAAEAKRIAEETKSDHDLHIATKPAFDELQAQLRASQAIRETTRQLELQQHQQQHELELCQQQRKELDQQEEELATLAPAVEAFDRAERDLKRLQQQRSTLPFLNERLADIEHTLRAHNADEAALKRELEQLTPLQPAVQELSQVKEDGTNLRHQIETWQKQNKERQALQQTLHELSSQAQTTRTRLEQVQRQEAELRHELQPLAQRLDEHEKMLRQFQEQLDRIALKRERDAAFQKDVSGGICPFFEQSCKNVPEGQRLDQYLQASIKRSDKEVKQLEQQLRDARQHRDQAERAQRQLHEQTPRHRAQMESEKRELERIAQVKREREAECQRIPNREQDIAEANQHILALRERFRQLKPAAESVQKLPSLRESLHRLQKDLASRREEQQKLQREQASLVALGPREEALVKEVQELEISVRRHRELVGAVVKRPQLEARQRKCEQALKEIETKLQEAKTNAQQHVPDEAEWQRLRDILANTETGYTRYLQHVQMAQNAEERQQRHTELEKQHNQAREDVVKRQSELVSRTHDFSLESLRETEQTLQTLVLRSGELQGSLPRDRSAHARLTEEIDVLQTKRATMADVQAEHSAVADTIECSQVLRRMYKDAAPHLTRALIRSISAEADRLFRHLLDQNHLHLRWEETFELMIEEEGQERGFKNLSGGEQMAAALAVRMALIKELSSIRLAFFDEPTAHLDAQRRYNLASQLAQVDGFDQLVVISHDDTFETMTDHVVWLHDLP